MEIKVLSPLEVPNWNHQIAKLSGATIFHTSNWARTLTESYSYQPKYFCTYKSGYINHLIPMMEINSSITGKRGCMLPFSDHVEPIVGLEGIDEMIEFMIRYGRDRRWRTIDFHGGEGLLGANKSDFSFILPYISLECQFEQLRNQFRSSTKRNIKKAEKLGVVSAISSSKQAIDEFYRLNSMTRKRHGIPPQPRRFFKNIYKCILAKNRGYACLAYYREKVIAGAIFFFLNDHAIFKYGASDPQFLNLRPNNLVISRAIKHAASLGIKSVSLGRTVKEDRGQLQFKMGWNAKPSNLSYYKIDVPSGKWISAKPTIRSTYFLFKLLPEPLLRIIGEMAYPHIG